MKILKKLGMILGAGFLVIALCPGGLSAAPLGSGTLEMSFGLNGAYVITSADDLGNSLGIGASFRVALNDYLSLGLDGGYSRVSASGTTAEEGLILQPGKLQQIPIQVMIELRLPLPNFPVTPYVTAGAGMSLNSFTLEATLVSDWDDLGYDVAETVKDAFVWSVGAGLDFRASSRLIINAHFLYRHCLAEATWSIVDQLSSESAEGTLTDLNFNAIVLGLGFKYAF